MEQAHSQANNGNTYLLFDEMNIDTSKNVNDNNDLNNTNDNNDLNNTNDNIQNNTNGYQTIDDKNDHTIDNVNNNDINSIHDIIIDNLHEHLENDEHNTQHIHFNDEENEKQHINADSNDVEQSDNIHSVSVIATKNVDDPLHASHTQLDDANENNHLENGEHTAIEYQITTNQKDNLDINPQNDNVTNKLDLKNDVIENVDNVNDRENFNIDSKPSSPKEPKESTQMSNNIDGNRHNETVNDIDQTTQKNETSTSTQSKRKRTYSDMMSNENGEVATVDNNHNRRSTRDKTWYNVVIGLLDQLKKSFKFSDVFWRPVDPITDQAPDYLLVCPMPSDFGTISQRLQEHSYSNIDDFLRDCELVFVNARTYNNDEHFIHQCSLQLEKEFKRKLNDFVERNALQLGSNLTLFFWKKSCNKYGAFAVPKSGDLEIEDKNANSHYF